MKRFLNIVQLLVSLVVFLLFSMGKGAHGVFIAIFLFIPAVRALLSTAYRQELTSRYQGFLASPTTVKAVFWLLMFPSLVLTLSNGIGISSNDNYPTMMTAASILTEGNLELSEYTPAPRKQGRDYCIEGIQNPYYIRCTLDGVRSAYPLGMVLPMLSTFGLAKLLGQDPYNADLQWRLSKWTASLLSAISIALFFLIARQLVSNTAAFLVSYLLMVGSTFTSIISQGPWSHDGVVLGTLVILFLEFTRRDLSNKKRIVAYAAAFAWMFSCRLNSISILGPLFIYLAVRRGVFFGMATGVLSVLFYLPLGLYYKAVYATYFGPQMVMGATSGIPANPFQGTMGILFSPAHGLIPYQPWVFLLLFFFHPQVRKALQDRLGNSFVRIVISAVLLHIAIVSQWWCWWGGTWGSRLMSEIVPLLALLVLFPVEYVLAKYRTRGRKGLVALTIFSFLFHAPHLFFFASNWNTDPLVGDLAGESRMWDWRSPPFLYPVLKKLRPMKPK